MKDGQDICEQKGAGREFQAWGMESRIRSALFIGECRGPIVQLGWVDYHMGVVEVKLEHQVWRPCIGSLNSWMGAPSACLVHPKGSGI